MSETAVVFAASPDWTDPVDEHAAYLTDVMHTNLASEQRLGLRTLPRPVLKFSLTEFTARDVAEVDALYWLNAGLRWAVPYWPDAVPLTGAVDAGATSVSVNTSQRAMNAGADLILWRDLRTFEVITAGAINADTITLKSGTATARAWAADGNTFVVPLMYGRQTDDAELAAITRGARSSAVSFECEPFAFPVGTWAEQYAGFDVLSIEPNRADTLYAKHARVTAFIDSRSGAVSQYDWAGMPVVSRRSIPFLLDGRDDVAAFRTFRANRRGQLKPFWFPTWNDDLSLAADLAAGATALTIQSAGYTARLFPNPARRVLCLFAGSDHYIRKVTASVSTDADTETLTIDAPLPVTLTRGACMVSFLTLCRLAADDPLMRWHTTTVAEFTIDAVEVPREVPA